MTVLKVIWFLVKWWFLIGAVSASIYVFVRYLRGQIKDSETWMFAILLLVAWPPVIYVGASTSWQDRHKIKDELFSTDSAQQLGQHKKLAFLLVGLTLVGLWMLIAYAGGLHYTPPKLQGVKLMCTSCNQTFEKEMTMGFSRDAPVKCSLCGKQTAWARAGCPICGKDFPYGLLQEQGSDRLKWKCPKCGKSLSSPQPIAQKSNPTEGTHK